MRACTRACVWFLFENSYLTVQVVLSVAQSLGGPSQGTQVSDLVIGCTLCMMSRSYLKCMCVSV